jgi:uncharacterized membrane protein (DUF485 family)
VITLRANTCAWLSFAQTLALGSRLTLAEAAQAHADVRHIAPSSTSPAGESGEVEETMADSAVSLRRDTRNTKSAHEVIESSDFKRLVKKRWSVSMILLTFLFVTYYGFILLVATNKTLVNMKIGEVTTLAIPLGLGAIVIAFVLTAVYVAWANKSYDPEVERLRAQLRK